MAKPEWGAKRTCHSCGARFYDLRRETIVCPVCSTVYDPERHPRTRRGGGTIKDDAVVLARVDVDAVKKKKAVKREAADDDVVIEIDDEEGADHAAFSGGSASYGSDAPQVSRRSAPSPCCARSVLGRLSSGRAQFFD